MRFLKYALVAVVLVMTQGCAVRTTVDRECPSLPQTIENLRAVLTIEAIKVLEPMRAGVVDSQHYARLLASIWHGADVALLGITEDEITEYAQALNTRTDVGVFVLRENQGRPKEVVMTNMMDVLDARFGRDNY